MYDVCYVYIDGEVFCIELFKFVIDCLLLYWESVIVFDLEVGKMVLVMVYGNLLCGFVKYFEGISDVDIVEFNIFMGILLVYELDENNVFIGFGCYFDFEVVVVGVVVVVV